MVKEDNMEENKAGNEDKKTAKTTSSVRKCHCKAEGESEISHEAMLTQEYAMSDKTKIREDDEYKDLVHRLNRIEGQIRGIRGMVDKDAYCIDILTQVAATRCALNSFTKVLLANHIRTCVTDDIRQGRDESVDELVDALQKLLK
jgi:DNA-binding FrmR family transcriptional regulator